MMSIVDAMTNHATKNTVLAGAPPQGEGALAEYAAASTVRTSLHNGSSYTCTCILIVS